MVFIIKKFQVVPKTTYLNILVFVQGEVTGDSLKEKLKQSLVLKDKSFEMEGKVQEAVAKAQTAVYETKDLMEGLLAEDRSMYKSLQFTTSFYSFDDLFIA